MSFLRSTIVTKPRSSITPMSPVASQPSASITFAVSSGRLPVARHHLRAADADLARLAERRRRLPSSSRSDDLGRRDRQADRAVVLGQVERIDRRRRRGLGEPVASISGTPVTSFQRSATACCTAMPPPSVISQRREVELRELRVVEQRVEQRVDAGERREPVACRISLTKPGMSRGFVISTFSPPSVMNTRQFAVSEKM